MNGSTSYRRADFRCDQPLHCKLKICLVAHAAYGAITGGNAGHIGGVERQTSLMAKWLVARGHRASLVTWDEGQADGVEIDGVRVFKLCRHNAGIPGLRFFWPRWSSLCAALKRADADVYYQNCGEYVTGQVAMWCRWYGRKFIYSVANDMDCDVQLPEMHTLRERLLYRYGLECAEKVIVQTRRQQEMLRRGFGLDSTVLPMPCPGPSDAEHAAYERDRSGTQRVLWIGRICKQKRPDRLLDLAELCPEVHFDLVGPAGESEYGRTVCERARTLKNVAVHGPVSRERVAEFYRGAKLLCCTSDFEGFPNTFLEAWSHGVPIVSTVDPDGLIASKCLGAVATDVPQLATGIRMFLNSPLLWQRASQDSREYFAANHAIDTAMTQFERVFCEVVDSRFEGRTRTSM